MSNHTPGPWFQHTARTERIIVNGSCVYEVRDTTTEGGFAGNGEGQPNPNDVRLMAAAPEMLAALKDLMELYSNGQLVIEGERDEGDDPVVGAAFHAIAKAEGRG